MRLHGAQYYIAKAAGTSECQRSHASQDVTQLAEAAAIGMIFCGMNVPGSMDALHSPSSRL